MIITPSKCRVARSFFDKITGRVYASIADIPRKKELDPSTMPVFLRIGYVPGNETLFEGIQCLPGGAEIEIENGEWRIIKQFRYENVINKDAYSDSTEMELILEGKKRWLGIINDLYRPSSKIVVPVSGGLDSRAILAGLLECTEATNVHTYTFGMPKSYDFEIGNRICRYLGTMHTKFDLSESKVTPEVLEKACKLSDGNANLFFSIHLMPIIETYGHEAEYWSGYMGGELAGSHLPKKPSTTYQKALEDYFVTAARRLYQDQLPCDRLSELSKIITSEPEDSDKLNYDEQLDFRNRGERCYGTHYFMTGYNYITPFVDDRWIEFILSVPQRCRLNRYLYKKVLKNCFPTLFSLPTKENFGLSLSAITPLVKLQKIKHRLAASLFPNSLDPMVNYNDFNKELREESALRTVVETALRSLQKRQIIEHSLIEQLWSEHQSRKRNNWFLLTNLASLEIIVRTFNVHC